MKSSCLIACFILSGAIKLSAAAPEDISISVNPAVAHVTIGDSLTVFCRVSAPPGISVSEPFVRTSSSLVDIGKPQAVPSQGGTASSPGEYRFLMYIFASDTLQVGPFAIRYTAADGDSGTVESDIITVIARGVVDSPEASPLPNRDPFEIAGYTMLFWLIVFLAVMAAAALIARGIVLYRRKKAARPVYEGPIDEKGEFERIRALKLFESGHYKELYFLVSTALRGFIHRNLNFDAMYETTHEITGNLSKCPENPELTGALALILEESDRVKFAKYTPAPEQVSTVIDRTLKPVTALLEEIERRKKLEEAACEGSPHEHVPVHISSLSVEKRKGGE